MFSLLICVIVYSLKWLIIKGEVTEKKYTDGSLLKQLERAYRRDLPIALSSNGLEGSSLTDLWKYVVCLNWVVQYLSSECPSEYSKPRCCYPDTCGDKYLSEFGIRKYKLCSETNYFPEVSQYLSSLPTVAVNNKKLEGKLQDPNERPVIDDDYLKELSQHYEDVSSSGSYKKTGKTIYHSDLPNITAVETYVQDFSSDDNRNENKKSSLNQGHRDNQVRYLKTNLDDENSDYNDENKSAEGSDDMSNDISKAVTSREPSA